MGYHNNKVEIQGKGGITVYSGNFKVTDFYISDKQDPESKNHIGDNHLLKENNFTFEVGRHGTSGTAEWFTNKVGNNQNTFKKNPNDLNFAFLGVLSLEISGGYAGSSKRTVTLNDIVFAQGHAGAVNNWWFGGMKSDYLDFNELACEGTDDLGNDIFAIFKRGGTQTDYKAVEIKRLVKKEFGNDHAVKLANPLTVFNSISDRAKDAETVNCDSGFIPEFKDNHVQGFTQYEQNSVYFLVTHSSAAELGHVLAMTKDGKCFRRPTHDWGYPHPGGIQALGDYLLVPVEASGSCHLRLYNLNDIPTKGMYYYSEFDLTTNDHQSTSAGITRYTDRTDPNNPVDKFVIVVQNWGTCYLYSAMADVPLPKAKFERVGQVDVKMHDDCQGIGLITGADDSLYMIAFCTIASGISFIDNALLFKITVDSGNVNAELMADRHLYSTGGGAAEPHYRYGAGIRFNSSGKLVLLASARNFINTELVTNHWV